MAHGSITSSTMTHSDPQTSKALESFLDWRVPRVASNFTSFRAQQSLDGQESGILSNGIQIRKCPGSTSVTRRRSGSQSSLYSRLVSRASKPEYIGQLSSRLPPQDSGIPPTSSC